MREHRKEYDMATSSLIMRVKQMVSSDMLKLEGITCYLDGYIVNGVGEILLQHYSSKNRLQMLFSLGDLEVLDKDIIKTAKRSKSGDVNIHIEPAQFGLFHTWGDIKEYIAKYILNSPMFEYVYVFYGNKWYVIEPRLLKDELVWYGVSSDFKLLSEALNDEREV